MSTRPAATRPEIPAKSREVRLGIVMYGGVSLAIYINGVAQELFNAVRGRGVYKLLKVITDSDIAVDVISGTSAGGINGLLLGYALCNGREFGDASALWREHGDLGQLLRSPDTSVAECLSVLDSKGYQAKIEQGLRRMRKIQDGSEEPSALNELDLFVTGTDVDGVVRTVFDDAGHPIDVKDHRAVFWLKHRRGRRHPFGDPDALPGVGPNEHVVPALAKLARVTSCFPVAFAPVKVQTANPTGADALLCEWGSLTSRGDVGGRAETYFRDGGVLDNKPFTYTLGAIFSRAATVDVDRALLYVEPDPETFSRDGAVPRPGPDGQPQPPHVVQAAVAALVTIPGYESISDDLRSIGERNSKIEQYNRVVRQLETAVVPPWPDLADETRQLHARARLVALTERVVEGVLNDRGVRRLMTRAQQAAAARLIREFDRLVTDLVRASARSERREPIPAALDVEQILTDFDVSFRQRRLYRIVYLIHELRRPPEAPEPEAAPSPSALAPAGNTRGQQYATVLANANRLLEVYEIVRWAMEGLVAEGAFPWDDPAQTWRMVHGALATLLDDSSPAAAHLPERLVWDDGGLSPRTLTDFYAALKTRRGEIVRALERGEAVAAPSGRSLLRRLDDLESDLLAHIPDPQDRVRQAHAGFRSLDALVYPLQLMSGVMEKDVIETVRVSPVDAQRGFSKLPAGEKISGDELHHFGGFLKASWRSNDILWGRLDGVCPLVERVLTPTRLTRVVTDKPLVEQIHQRLNELDPHTLFRESGPLVQARLSDWLRRLFDPNDPRGGRRRVVSSTSTAISWWKPPSWRSSTTVSATSSPTRSRSRRAGTPSRPSPRAAITTRAGGVSGRWRPPAIRWSRRWARHSSVAG